MILTVPSMFPREDKIHVVRDNETETFRSDFTERKAEVPQLLLVEQPKPDSHILTHFHSVDQFQIFMDGYGKLGNHPIEPISIHYTNSYTAYGPIIAGPKGMSYYVVRPGFDVDGSYYVHIPEKKAAISRGRKRSFVAEHIKARTEHDLRALKGIEVDRVIGVDRGDPDEGVFADIVSLPPGAQFTGADPKSGGGQVFLVLAGSLMREGKALGLRSAIALTYEEPVVTLHAGPNGAQFMALQYPRRHAKAS